MKKYSYYILSVLFLLGVCMSQPLDVTAAQGKSSIQFYMENKEVVEETIDSDSSVLEEAADDTSPGKLPQTGEKNNNYLKIMGISFLLILIIIKKKEGKKYEKIRIGNR